MVARWGGEWGLSSHGSQESFVMLSETKHLAAHRVRSFALLRMTSRGWLLF